MVLRMWMESLFEWAKFLGYGWFSSVREVVIQVLTIVVVVTVLFWTALFMYGSFYYTYMPSASHVKDIHFQFRTDCEINSDKFYQLCSFPSANISLTRESNKPFLKRGQPYVISLLLDMPESPVNHHQGMFMVEINIYTKHGQVVKVSRRSSMIRYKSDLLKTLETWVFLGSYLFGRLHQKQLIQVDLFEDFEEDPYKPTVGAVLEIQTKQIEIYNSRLVVHAQFYGLRYLMFYYPVMTASAGVMLNLFFLLVITIFSWYKFGPEARPDEATVSLAKTHISWDEPKKPHKVHTKERASRKTLTTETVDSASQGFKSDVEKLVPETITLVEGRGNGEETFEMLHGREEEMSSKGIRKRTLPDTK